MASEKELIESLEKLENTIDTLIGNRKHYSLYKHKQDRQWLALTNDTIHNNLQAVGISLFMVEGTPEAGWEGADEFRFGKRYLKIKSGELNIGVEYGNFFRRTLISTSKEDIFQFHPFVRRYMPLTEKNYNDFIYIIDSVSAEISQHFRVEKGLKDGLENIISDTTQKYLNYVNLQQTLPEKTVSHKAPKI